MFLYYIIGSMQTVYVYIKKNSGLREGVLFVTNVKKSHDNIPIDDLLVQEDECILQEVYGGYLRRKSGKFSKNKKEKLMFHNIEGSFFAEIHEKKTEVLNSCLS